jgi:hypothetical protein
MEIQVFQSNICQISPMRLESIVNESTVPVYMPDFGILEVPLLPLPQLHTIIPIKDT